MTTVDQFLKALAYTESCDDPEAWGDAGRAMGRWQVHPDRLFDELRRFKLAPELGETWDQLAARVLRAIFENAIALEPVTDIAMYWHVGHWTAADDADWDAQYAAQFNRALAKVQAG